MLVLGVFLHLLTWGESEDDLTPDRGRSKTTQASHPPRFKTCWEGRVHGGSEVAGRMELHASVSPSHHHLLSAAQRMRPPEEKQSQETRKEKEKERQE